MAFFSLHAYDADVWIPAFRGIRQDENLNPDIRFADKAENVETPSGVLQPHAAFNVMRGTFTDRVETLATLHRRWYEGLGSKDWLICASGGKLYYMQSGEDDQWYPIPMPGAMPEFGSNVWSWVTYERPDPISEKTVDVMLISNATDGMFMVIPPDRPTTHDDLSAQTHDALAFQTHNDLTSPAWQVQDVDTEGYRFGVIERYAERIWGTAVAGEPDKLVYSRPYDPMDWSPAGEGEQPEDGGGEIDQPSWDGDSFKDMKAFGGQLIAFKEHKAWRVMGTSPGEFELTEQFGGGAPYFNTVAVDVEQIVMANRDGLEVYDGMSTRPYARNQFDEIWRSINKDAMDQMCAAMWQGRYYLAIPVDGSTRNNALLVVDTTEGTNLYYNDISIEAFMQLNDRLYATSSDLPGKIIEMHYDSWQAGKATGAATRWVSPWTDFGYKKIVKGGFELYFTPEVQDEPVTIRFSIQTEKKTKTKQYTCQPLNVVSEGMTWEAVAEKTWGEIMEAYKWKDLSGKTDIVVRQFRHKRLHFSGTGRRFRVIIETDAGVTAPWRLIGGLHMVVETDPD